MKIKNTKFVIFKTVLLVGAVMFAGINLKAQVLEEVFKYDGTAIGSGNNYAAKSGSYTNNGITMTLSASIGAVQSDGFWLGTNSNSTNVNSSTLANYPGIASALGLSGTKNRVAALLFGEDLSDIGKITYSQSAGQASTQIALVCSTDEGVSYRAICVSGCEDGETPVFWQNLNTQTTDVVFTFTPVAKARYAIVINKTTTSGYVQSKVPVVTFYKETVKNPYTVTFDPGTGDSETLSLTEAAGGAGVILPVAVSVNPDWEFIGWAASSISGTDIEPVIYQADDTYYPSENTTLYAVYKKGETGMVQVFEQVMTLTGFDYSAEYAVLGGKYTSGDTDFAAMDVSSASNAYLGVYDDISVTGGTDNIFTLQYDENIPVWTFAGDGSGFTISRDDKILYAASTSSLKSVDISDDTSSSFILAPAAAGDTGGADNSDLANRFVFTIGDGKGMLYYNVSSLRFRNYTSSPSQTMVKALYLFKKTSVQGTVYTYDTNPAPAPVLSVDPEAIPFGEVYTDVASTAAQLTVSGENLTENISYILSDQNEGNDKTAFVVSEVSGQWSGKDGGLLNIVFTPTEARTYSATLTVSSTGVDSKTVTLTGEGAIQYSSEATITSTIYTVDNDEETISGIPYNTPIPTFKLNCTPAEGARIEVYETDGTTVASSLVTGYKVIVTAEDQTTRKTYRVDLLGAPTGDLVISEYIGGSGDNKALEIYNGTGVALDLSPYRLEQGVDGAGWGVGDIRYSYPLTGILAAGEVLVLANSQASQAILDKADIIFESETSVSEYTVPGCNILSFNGNDAIGLFGNDILIDAIGVGGEKPESGWAVAGIAAATQNKTLVRKGITGNPDWAVSAGTNAADSEWIVYDQDNFTYLGSHSISRILYVSPASLSFGNIEIDKNSEPSVLTISGSNLTGNITYEVTEGYESVFAVSEDNWDAQTGGTLKVAFNPTAVQDYNATLTIRSEGVEDKIVGLSGKGIVIPEISITSPENDAKIYLDEIYVTFAIKNFDVPADGKIKVTLTGGHTPSSFLHKNEDPVKFNFIEGNEYTVEMELVNPEGESLNPAVKASVTFTVDLLSSVSSVNTGVVVWTNGGQLHIKSDKAGLLKVYALSGSATILKKNISAGDNVIELPGGVYIIDLNGKRMKVVL